MIVGKSYSALDTIAVKRNGLLSGERGHVMHVDGAMISLAFARVNIQLAIPRPLFGMNFERCTLDTKPNLGFRDKMHATTIFKLA